jgi:ribosome-associated protein
MPHRRLAPPMMAIVADGPITPLISPENTSDRLIANDEAFTKMIEQYPDMDIQNMRTLIRNARREKEQNKPPKAYREIFRVLKDMGL